MLIVYVVGVSDALPFTHRVMAYRLTCRELRRLPLSAPELLRGGSGRSPVL
jgi:hypothetical protein